MEFKKRGCFVVKYPLISFFPKDPNNDEKNGVPYFFEEIAISYMIPLLERFIERGRENPLNIPQF